MRRLFKCTHCDKMATTRITDLHGTPHDHCPSIGGRWYMVLGYREGREHREDCAKRTGERPVCTCDDPPPEAEPDFDPPEPREPTDRECELASRAWAGSRLRDPKE